MSDPVRMCIGCRERAPKDQLLRLVWNGRLIVDVDQTAPGRGAYLHRDQQCLQQAVRRRAVGRALRVSAAGSAELAIEGLSVVDPVVQGIE